MRRHMTAVWRMRRRLSSLYRSSGRSTSTTVCRRGMACRSAQSMFMTITDFPRYFLFQAVLIPCICLRNEPSAASSASWREQIATTLQTITAMSSLNASCARCYSIISELCGRYLDNIVPQPDFLTQTPIVDQPNTDAGLGMNMDPSWLGDQPVGESPQTQINRVFSMMWPNVPPLEAADVVMGDDAGWMEFLRAGSADGWGGPGSKQSATP